MSNEKSLEDYEAEYREILKKKTAIMREELEEKEKIKAQEEADKKKADEEAAFKAAVDSRLEELGVEIGEDGGLPEDPKPEKKKGDKVKDKDILFMKNFAETEGLKKFASYETLAESYAADGVAAFTDSDSGCDDDVSAWERDDCFASVIWQDVLCKSGFAGKITVRGLDFKQGCGGKVQIRTINVADPSSDFGAMSPCECLSCVSNTFSTYTLTMETYGDYKVLCDLDLFTAGDSVKKAVMKSMVSRASERIDFKIYAELFTNSPTYSETLGAACGDTRGTDGACCTYAVDLYDKIVDLEAAMRADGYFDMADPILIISPTVAAYLKYKDGLNMPSYIASQISMDGLKLAGIGNIKVIESCHAIACTDAAQSPQAILIDPSRAIGEAWGKKPTFKTDDDPIECGSQKVVLRMWADFAVLDTAAVGHIINP